MTVSDKALQIIDVIGNAPEKDKVDIFRALLSDLTIGMVIAGIMLDLPQDDKDELAAHLDAPNEQEFYTSQLPDE